MPFLVVSTALMFGNWLQHAFVKPDDPRQLLGLAYTVVNHPDNQLYNDGFHTLHHVNSQIHWSEFPNKFVEKLGEHAEKDALVFDGIGFFDVGFALFFHRHGSSLTGTSTSGRRRRPVDEVIALLKERLKPIKFDKEKEASKKVK